MDRYLVREPRVSADYPQGNEMVGFSTNSVNNNKMIPETMYFGGYGAEFPSPRSGFIAMTHVNAMPNPTEQGQIVSGIDPRYLAAYSDANAVNFLTGQRQQNVNVNQSGVFNKESPFINNYYENRDFVGIDRSKPSTFSPQTTNYKTLPSAPRQNDLFQSRPHPISTPNTIKAQAAVNPTMQGNQQGIDQKVLSENSNPPQQSKEKQIVLKSELQTPLVKSRAEKLKELHKSGVRVFSGPVENVLKWHKMVQDLGAMVLYEIVAKCVSVRPGEACAKNLVVRDDNGPAMQVVYYEIDFLLPELKPPCTIRVVGRMMPGTCRLQAFNVRLATGDDVATLPRRAAVAAHHVAKICKEYGNNH